jgi:hypothetical protein
MIKANEATNKVADVNAKSSKCRKKSDQVKLPIERPESDYLSQTVERLRIAEEDLWIRYQAGDLSIVGDWISVITQLRISRNQADKRKEAGK